MGPVIKSLDALEPRIAQELGFLGNNPAWTCVADNRFCYFLYIPKSYYSAGSKLPLIVPVHGSDRDPESLRREFAPLAEARCCAVLAPLFPVGLIEPQDVNNCKLIKYREVRYDRVLLAMIGEARCRFGKIDTERFLLYGFSGGGQFVHRFAYLHPERIRALACGAPGTQTLPDASEAYPGGVRDLEQIFGTPLEWDKVKAIPTVFVAGDADTDSFHAIARGRTIDDSAACKDGRYGATVRLERSWARAGANCHMHVVPGAEHDEKMMLPAVKQFFEQLLRHGTEHGDGAEGGA